MAIAQEQNGADGPLLLQRPQRRALTVVAFMDLGSGFYCMFNTFVIPEKRHLLESFALGSCGDLLNRTKCHKNCVHNESFNLGTLSFYLLSIPAVKIQFIIVKALVAYCMSISMKECS